MKSKDILTALGDTDDKYINSAKKMMQDRKPQSKTVSAFFGTLKFAAGAVLVLAVVLAIWIPSVYIKNHQDPASSDTQTDTQTDTNTEPVDTARYNCFVCGDQAVEGLKGLIYCTEYRDEQGAWIEGDGLGISFELIDMTDPPTLYFKPGDKITFIYDPDVTPGGLQLWNSEGTNTVASEYASQYSPDLYSYLEENPGQYYITAGYYTYGRTIGDKRESYGYTRGVRLICEGPAGSTDEQTEEPVPKTDEEIIAALVDDLAANGYDAEKWLRLTSYGSIAFDQLIRQYYKGAALDAARRTVISCFAADYLRREISVQESKIFEGLTIPDPSTGLSDESNASWLYDYSAKVTTKAKVTEELDFARLLPRSYRFIELRNFGHLFPFTPEKNTASGCVDIYVKYKSAKTNETVTNKISKYLGSYALSAVRAEAAAYCAVRYQTETDPTARALYGWLFSQTAHGEVSDIAGYKYINALYAIGNNYINESRMWDHKERFEPVIGEFIPLAESFMANYPKKQAKTDHPITCAALDALGFDGYKPGEPDIAFEAREAVSALGELYRAVRYGYYRTGLSESVTLNEIVYKVNVQYRGEISGMNVTRYECSEEEFYAYFEKHVSRDIIETFIRDNAIYAVPGADIPDPATSDEERALYMPIYVYDGKISLSGDIGYQSMSGIIASSARLIEQSGNKATIGVLFDNAHGMVSTGIEMELQIVKDNNGIRVTGGEMIDKMFTKTQAEMEAAVKTFICYRNLREGSSVNASDLYYIWTYERYNNLSEAYKERFSEDDLPLFEVHLFTEDGECLLDRIMSKKIREELIKPNAVYDGEFIHPENAPGRVEAAFIGGPKIKHGEYDDVYLPDEFMAEAKIVKSGKNGSTFSIDIKVDGKVKAYTFEVTYDNGTPKVTGGTFVTEVIFGK